MNNRIKNIILHILPILLIPVLLAGCTLEEQDDTHILASKDKNFELTVPDTWTLVKDEMKSDYSIIASTENDAEGIVFWAQSKEYVVNNNGEKISFDELYKKIEKNMFPVAEVEEISKDPIDDMQTISYCIRTDDNYYYVVSVMEDEINYYVTASGTGIEKDFDEEKFLEINKTLNVKETVSLITDENGKVILSEPHEITSEDEKLAITVPSGWSEYDKKVNQHTLFSAIDPLQNNLCYVDQYAKGEVTDEDEEEMSFDEVIDYLDEQSEIEPVTTWAEIASDPVSGKPAKTYAFSNSTGHFVGTIVEDANHYYTVVVGTSDEAVYNQEVYKGITTSLEIR